MWYGVTWKVRTAWMCLCIFSLVSGYTWTGNIIGTIFLLIGMVLLCWRT